MSRRNPLRSVDESCTDQIMADLECQLDLVDYAQGEYGAEAFHMLVLPALAMRIPGLAVFVALAAAS